MWLFTKHKNTSWLFTEVLKLKPGTEVDIKRTLPNDVTLSSNIPQL